MSLLNQSQIFSVVVRFSESIEMVVAEGIFYESKFWLVSEWSAVPSEGWQEPTRLVCIHDLNYESLADHEAPADYLLRDPMPKSVLYGDDESAQGQSYEILKSPDIRFSVGRA